MADADRKRELIAQLDRARSRAAAHHERLADDLQVADKLKHGLKENVEHNRGIWLGGAALFGLLISKIPPRTKVLVSNGTKDKVAREAKTAGKWGLVMAGLTWVFNLVRPMLISWGTRRLQQTLAGMGSRPPSRRL